MSIASSVVCRSLLWFSLSSLVTGVTSAQTSFSALIPHVELLRPRIQPGTLAQDLPVGAGLHILIIKGDRGINVIKKKTAVTPVIEVRDRNDLPVAGAAVTFTAPNNGASIVFMDGSRSATVIADTNGRAAAQALRPVNLGQFQVSVSATSQSQIATTATISMTNVLTAAAATAAAAGVGGTVASGAGAAGFSAGVIGAIVGVAAAAAVGVGVGLSHHGSTSPATSTPSATIGGGTGATFGAPH